ncbi:MAG: hypothetical protein E7262_10260 [Lachnospiraceae bacterium]|nr:hypothetical protein [Lachnospiraceae bacterium]
MSVVKKIKNMDTMKKAVIVSVWGALVSGVVACMGSSMTVFMDFCRCLLEGAMTVVTYIVFLKINKQAVSKRKETVLQESIRFVTGLVMICTSILLATVSMASFSPVIAEGNNIPSLFTTGICTCINFKIYRNYKKDLEKNNNHIVRAQYTMYRLKTCINSFVLFVIGIMIFAPSWSMIPYIDLVGTCIIAVVMLNEGIKNMKSIETKLTKTSWRKVRRIVSFVTSL